MAFHVDTQGVNLEIPLRSAASGYPYQSKGVENVGVGYVQNQVLLDSCSSKRMQADGCVEKWYPYRSSLMHGVVKKMVFK